ncbi:PilZ domain-containing protein [Flavisphingomonas formosensis]|uniref:PilZ domain-containing protein n=1 Tax=Flavisphingomonas formosensis TaxID=861534 RepID=UPI0012F9CF42|nr:PilZ domain-containing protein [Sphingomonas formosensis]
MEELTAISPSPVVPRPPEKTLSNRHLPMLQAGKLITDTQQSLCLLRVISAAGVMAHASRPFSEGEPVAVGFRSSHVLPGHVVWTRGELIGVAFDKVADLDIVLAMQRRAVDGRFLPESVRLQVEGEASIETPAGSFPTELFDISLAGAKIGDLPELEVEMSVSFAVAGLPVRSGSLRWKEDGRAGIAFNLSMPYDVLAGWALKQRPRIVLSDILATQG